MSARGRTARKPRECPCHSGRAYAACCAPLHAGDREAATPAELMRARYAAFALGLGAFLVRTLAADHSDRAEDDAVLARAYSRMKETQRFLDLTIHRTRAGDREGEVIFTARIFERGLDRSFTERSRFVREGDGWRYAGGDLCSEVEP
jgi:SEC-C motif-containing protein